MENKLAPFVMDDTINGLLNLAFEKSSGPINIGSTEEISILNCRNNNKKIKQ